MLVETIKMDPRIARVHYSDYRKRCRVARQERLEQKRKELTQIEREDEELLKAYRALSRGERILNVTRVIAAAGVDPKTYHPKLAIARSDAEWCELNFSFYSNTVDFIAGPSSGKWGYRVARDKFEMARTHFPAETWDTNWRAKNGLGSSSSSSRALVPAVPIHLRPDNLGNYHTLWEAEWKAQAPVDPILLKRISRSMFVVVAQWDLTPLEQQVLEGRL